MNQLRCDICGGQIEMQPDKRGLCLNCGTSYSLATMKEMFSGVKVSVTGSNEDVEQWRQLLDRYYSAGDFNEAERIVKKILEAVPLDQQAAEKYEQLQILKFMDVRNGVLKAYSGTARILTVPNIVAAIDPEVFAGNDYLEEIFLPEGLSVLRNGLFRTCKNLKKVHIPNSVTVVEDRVFEFCTSLNDVLLPQNLDYLGDRAFGSCTSLTEIEIPASVQKIGPLGRADDGSYSYVKGTFSCCDKLGTVKFNQGLKEIGCYAFYKTALEKVELPCGVETIGSGAFGQCTSLKCFVIPDSMTANHYSRPAGIYPSRWNPHYPWEGCSNLETIIYPQRFDSSIFRGTKYYDTTIIPQIRQKDWRSRGRCQHCGGSFGFFGRCKECGELKDY